jgi:hypothetical protein
MANNVNEERMRKFRDMGIPLPMAPVDPATVQLPVRNTEFAKKLMEIRNGAKKEELSTFIEKEKAQAVFKPLEMPAKKNAHGKAQAKPLTENIAKPSISGPSFDVYEKTLYGEGSNSNESNERTSGSGRNYVSDMGSDSNGSDFITNMKHRLAEKFTNSGKVQQSGQVILNENQDKSQGQVIPAGYTLVNENKLKDTITSISTQLIKKFMSEFLTSQPNLIKENEKIKKAEIIKEDIVKIDGKLFKLTPVTIKKK